MTLDKSGAENGVNSPNSVKVSSIDSSALQRQHNGNFDVLSCLVARDPTSSSPPGVAPSPALGPAPSNAAAAAGVAQLGRHRTRNSKVADSTPVASLLREYFSLRCQVAEWQRQQAATCQHRCDSLPGLALEGDLRARRTPPLGSQAPQDTQRDKYIASRRQFKHSIRCVVPGTPFGNCYAAIADSRPLSGINLQTPRTAQQRYDAHSGHVGVVNV